MNLKYKMMTLITILIIMNLSWDLFKNDILIPCMFLLIGGIFISILLIKDWDKPMKQND